MTKQERHLWYDFLKNHKYHWYKQRVIGNYIVDFYCASVKLAIELDGSQHYEGDSYAYDESRTKFLNEQGIRVIRIMNRDVDRNFEGVCRMIDNQTSQSASADSSPERGANERYY